MVVIVKMIMTMKVMLDGDVDDDDDYTVDYNDQEDNSKDSFVDDRNMSTTPTLIN